MKNNIVLEKLNFSVWEILFPGKKREDGLVAVFDQRSEKAKVH